MFVMIPSSQRRLLAALFDGHRPSCIMDSVLEGRLGTALADDASDPALALLAYADVVAVGGDASHPLAPALIEKIPIEKGILPPPAAWQTLIKHELGPNVIGFTRYPFSSHALDMTHLRTLMNARPAGFILRRIDQSLAQRIWEHPEYLSEDQVCNWPSPQYFLSEGIGFCILKGERIVSGASSYASCTRGIEVQVNTHKDYRRLGLATVVSAALLAYCLEQGLDPRWDAANQTSAHLARRLGYVPEETYTMLVRIPAE